MTYDKRHGGPYDRGRADSYYGRPRNPHYHDGRGMLFRRINLSLTPEEEAAYHAGYDANERSGEKKDWGTP